MNTHFDIPSLPHPPRRLLDIDARRLPTIDTDVLVLGCGVAGLTAAIEAARGGQVLVVSKGSALQSATQFAQGGIAAAWSEEDSVEAHAADTLLTGCGLCDPEAVSLVISQAPDEIRELESLGARFDRHNNRLDLGREGGHSAKRVIHAQGDATGAEIMRTLLQRANSMPRIRLLDDCLAVDLLTRENRVVGAMLHRSGQGLITVRAKVTILATGGAAALYRDHTNPPTSTGDGIAMAIRAGAVLRDMEFVQFHPTVFFDAQGRALLITEALRGEGAVLCDASGRRFMHDFDPRGELAPRDVVSRAIHEVLRRTKSTTVFLDARHMDTAQLAARFPFIHQNLLVSGIHPGMQMIPVRPAAHYTIGGVLTDLDARTSLEGLLACGEVASTGLHGANRLASNSLLEGLVFGRRAGRTAQNLLSRFSSHETPEQVEPIDPGSADDTIRLTLIRQRLKAALQSCLGIERECSTLQQMLDELHCEEELIVGRQFTQPDAWMVQNAWTVSACMAMSADWRHESRGVHYRTDYPRTDDARWRVHSCACMTADSIQISSECLAAVEKRDSALMEGSLR